MLASIILTPFFLGIFLWLFSKHVNLKEISTGFVVWYVILIAKSLQFTYYSTVKSIAGSFIYVFKLYDWSTTDNINLTFNIYLDFVALIMITTVLIVASSVFLFSIYYMGIDPFFYRFLALLNIFTFCMLLLVSAGDLLQLIIGWELVGLCSYFLINYWYTRISANRAANKAMLLNRIGDFFFILALSLCIKYFNTLSIVDISHYIIISELNEFIIIAICLLVAVMSKSAQFGLHMWLPDAMEGPTPVSALIHAATMVTAGIYLMIRMSILFIYCPDLQTVVVILGALTALFGATTGAAQSDLKKIIAFSTCSQLGYMVVACGFGEFGCAFYHLVTHAFFKALLFICAGVVIHTLGGEQDLRRMGSLANVLPITFSGMTIASLSLCGFPFLSGYYSKEQIIGISLSSGSTLGFSVAVTLILAAAFTSLYSVKILYFVYISKTKISLMKFKSITAELNSFSDFFFVLPIIVLSIFSIFAGAILKDILIPVDSNPSLSIYDNFLVSYSKTNYSEFLSIFLRIILNICSVFGFIFYSSRLLPNCKKFKVISVNPLYFATYSFFFNRWYFDFIVSYYISSNISLLLISIEKIIFQNSLLGIDILGTVKNIFLNLPATNQKILSLSAKDTLRMTFISITLFCILLNILII